VKFRWYGKSISRLAVRDNDLAVGLTEEKPGACCFLSFVKALHGLKK